MSSIPRDSSAPAPKDVPRSGFTCVSYLPGHDVHYIPVLKFSATRRHSLAQLAFSGKAFQLHIGDEVHVVQTHNPQALRQLIEDFGGACKWYPSLNYACWPHRDVRHWVNLSLEGLTPCVSVEEGRRREWETWT